MLRRAVVRSIWRARRFIDRAQSYTMAKERAGSPITTWNEYLTHAKDVHKFTITVGTVQDNHHDCNNGRCRQDDNDYVNKKQRNQTDYHDFNNEQCRKEDNDYVNEKQHNKRTTMTAIMTGGPRMKTITSIGNGTNKEPPTTTTNTTEQTLFRI